MLIGSQRLRNRLLAKEPVLGMMINFASPWLVDMLGIAGFDCIVLDAEHGYIDPSQSAVMLRVANENGMSVMARVPNSPREIQRHLDMGVEAIMVPHVDSPADAHTAASAMRFPPDGERGLTTITRVARYGIDTAPAAFVAASNAQLLCCPMIETPAGVAAADAIAATPGVDGLMIGSGDLAASMGLAGQRDHPEVLAACGRIAASARANGKWIGHSASDAAGARKAIEAGADLVIAPPITMIVGAARDFVRSAKGL